MVIYLCFDMYKCTYITGKKGAELYQYKTICIRHCSFPGEIRTIKPCTLTLFCNLSQVPSFFLKSKRDLSFFKLKHLNSPHLQPPRYSCSKNPHSFIGHSTALKPRWHNSVAADFTSYDFSDSLLQSCKARKVLQHCKY